MHEKTVERLIRDGYDFDLSLYIDRGIKIFTEKLGLFVGYTAIYFLVGVVCSFTGIGSVVMIVVKGPLIAGFYIMANSIVRKEAIIFERFFDGFKIFLPLFLASLVADIFVSLGIFLLIVPGIFLAVVYSFKLLFILFLEYDFWESMEASRKIITKRFWPFLGFFIIITLINVLGALMFGVGLLFTLPASMCMVFAAFEDIVGNAVREDQFNQTSNTVE